MIEKVEVIAFLGVIGSGKSYNTNQLINKGYLNVNFADEVREVCWDILSWRPKDDFEYEIFKQSQINIELIHSKKVRQIASNTIINSDSNKKFTGRDLLVLVGDGFRNRFYENIWLDAWMKKVKKSGKNKIVISDCRYLNEVFYLLSVVNFDVKFIFCNYKSERYTIYDNTSEKLAQELLKTYTDQTEINPREFFDIARRWRLTSEISN